VADQNSTPSKVNPIESQQPQPPNIPLLMVQGFWILFSGFWSLFSGFWFLVGGWGLGGWGVGFKVVVVGLERTSSSCSSKVRMQSYHALSEVDQIRTSTFSISAWGAWKPEQMAQNSTNKDS